MIDLVDGAWEVRALGAPHVGQRSEAELIDDFAAKVGRLQPHQVEFGFHAFDLASLRYRALITGVAVPGLSCRPYHHRYDASALDLCDVLAGYDARGKVGLDALCRAMGLLGKAEGMDDGAVAALAAQGRFNDIAAYCRSDLIATAGLLLACEHTRGALDPHGYARSRAALDPAASAAESGAADTATSSSSFTDQLGAVG